VPQAVRQRLWFHHDGALAQYGEDVQQQLNVRRWIGHGELTAWSLWSLDLTPMDFILWRYLKEHIYTVLPRTVKDFMARL
jgi:hypothetical protein